MIVGGSGSSPQWKELLSRLKPASLELKFQDDGYGPSDHASFYARNIPVLFFFTGVHRTTIGPAMTLTRSISQAP